MKKNVVYATIIILLTLAGFLFINNPKSTGNTIKSDTPLPTNKEENYVEITQNGFSPQTITISVGESVTWINKYALPSWPASNIHPTHTIYPGSSLDKCRTLDKDKIFDACGGLAKEETWSFTFNEAGTWRYHDHLDPSAGGIIIVK